MPAPDTYRLTLEPTYQPSVESPEYMVGQVLFQEAETRRLACRVEVRAAWTTDGEIEVATPNPAALPGLNQGAIQQRARALVSLFRDDKLSGRRTAGGDPSEP